MKDILEELLSVTITVVLTAVAGVFTIAVGMVALRCVMWIGKAIFQ